MTRFLFVSLMLSPLLLIACDSPATRSSSPPDRPKTSSAPDVSVESNTPAAMQLARFINAVRSGERSTVKTLIREDMAGFLQEIPIEQHVDELMGFHAGFSEIIFHDLVRNDPHAAKGRFQNQDTGDWVHIGVEVTKTEPHAIVVIELEPASAPI